MGEITPPLLRIDVVSADVYSASGAIGEVQVTLTWICPSKSKSRVIRLWPDLDLASHRAIEITVRLHPGRAFNRHDKYEIVSATFDIWHEEKVSLGNDTPRS